MASWRSRADHDASVPSDDQGADDVTALDDEGFDKNAPFDAVHDAREVGLIGISAELAAHPVPDPLERDFGTFAHHGLELETGHRLFEVRDHGNYLGPGDDLEKRLDDETGLFARWFEIRVCEARHEFSTLADKRDPIWISK